MKFNRIISLAIVSCLAAPVLSIAIGSVQKRALFQWPSWLGSSTGVKEDIPVPGSTKFDPDVHVYSPKCLVATATLKSHFDLSCFEQSHSLYFSSSGEVCKPNCLNTTIALSQYLVEKCSLQPPSRDEPIGYNHKDYVYLSWADPQLSKLVCNGPSGEKNKNGNQPGQCYASIFAAETAREANSLNAEDEAIKSMVCNDCTREWTELVESSKYHITPMLYYGHIPDTERLALWVKEKCHF